MNFQQLRAVREAVRCGYNLTEVAQALHTSQPGISRQIRELEDELGVALFARAGKRLTGLTEPGRELLPVVERMLLDAHNLRRLADDHLHGETGTLSVAATHSQARYALPTAVRDFRATHPQVRLHLHQGSAQQVAQMLLDGSADIGIASRALDEHADLVAMPCYRWTHCVVVPPDHALIDGELTLARLAAYPLVTYDQGFTGRGSIDDAFARAGLAMQIVLSAMDADVIKTYVELGLGVGVVASIAFDEQRDAPLRALDARQLFPINTTLVGMRRGAVLRRYAYRFVETFAPHLTPAIVRPLQMAVGGGAVPAPL